MSQNRIGREKLQSRVTEQLLTYLGAGSIGSEQLPKTLTPSDVKFTDPKSIKQLHFALSTQVEQFLEALPTRLRQLKTTTTTKTRQSHGEIHGRVNWNETMARQAQRGFTDPTVFTIQTNTVEIQTPENRLLKKILGIILEGIELLQEIDRPWWDGTDPSPAWLKRTLEEHVHLQALPKPEQISLTERELEDIRRSRHSLYTESYQLYRCYQDFIADRIENPDVRKIYEETLVSPADEATLFELYCLFEFITAKADGAATFEQIRPGMDVFAQLEKSDDLVQIYHNRGEPIELSYSMPPESELPSDMPMAIRQRLKAIRATWKSKEGFLNTGSHETYYQGQPDLLWLRFSGSSQERELVEVCLGEAKYTGRKNRFKKGLEQIQEYIHLAQWDGEFLVETEVPIYGYLFTDSVLTEQESVGRIQHLRMDELTTDQLAAKVGGLQ